MKKILILSLFFASCSTQKRYSYEAINLQEGEISKYHVRAELVSIKPTQKGYKHIFVSDGNDTIIRFFAKPLEVNHCYYVWKTKLDK